MVESREGVGRREEKNRRDTQTDLQMDRGTGRWRNREMDRHVWNGQKTRKHEGGGGRERGRKGRREKSRDSLIREMNESRSLIMVHCAKKVLSGSP